MDKSHQSMQYAQVSQEIPSQAHGCLEEELKYPVFTRSMATKRRSKITGRSSETLLYNSGLYIYIIHKHANFIFPQKGLISGNDYVRGGYNQRDLHVLNLMDL